MAKPDSLQGSLDLLVLKLLSRRPKLHGYAIMTAIRDWSEEILKVEEGSLYPALHRMEEAGWIRAEWTTKENGKRARMYELTASGRKQLVAEEARWQSVTAAVNRCAQMGATLQHLARNLYFGLAGVVARVLATAPRIGRNAAGLVGIGLVSG